MAFDRLIENIVKTQNPSVVGLDPKLEYVPKFIIDKKVEKHGKSLKAAAKALLEFNKAIIDEIHDICPAIKPQAAYYEMYGYEGVKTLYKTIQYAQEKGMFVMTDGKRNDIGATMEAYATAHLGLTDVCGEQIAAFGSDALTVNGYLGTDGIKPLLKSCDENDCGIFVLVKTSNPSSGELQDQPMNNSTLYRVIGDMCEKWGDMLPIGNFGYSSVGAVVGATYPNQLTELRKSLKKTFFLVPGYGAQGGGAADIVGAFDKDGIGAVINSSRAVMCAYKNSGMDGRDYAEAARAEALRMKNDINSNINKR